MDAGAAAAAVGCLGAADPGAQELHVEACWLLTQLAAGHPVATVAAGAVPELAALLEGDRDDQLWGQVCTA